jgi:predicted Fe-Mo cluster-binding NifX family protein
LSAASIRIFIIDKDMTVQQALSEWKKGKLQETSGSTIEGHWV